MAEARQTRMRLEHLRAWRIRRGFSQGELAELAGVAKSTVTNLETGKASANFVTVGKLADKLGITREQLLYSDPDGRAEA